MVDDAVITMITFKKKLIDLKVTLVLFPANATHFIQLLDIAAFKPYNAVFKDCVS